LRSFLCRARAHGSTRPSHQRPRPRNTDGITWRCLEKQGHIAKTDPLPGVVKAAGEEAIFKPGDNVKIDLRFPIGHYRVPTYVRGKNAVVEAVIDPPAVNNEEEGFVRNAGSKLHYYRVAILLSELWPHYSGNLKDALRIEIFETWLERR
jgi:hypothetical protein